MAEEKDLTSICQPVVASDASVLILGPAPSEILQLWPDAINEKPDAILAQRYELAVLVDPQQLLHDEITINQLLAAARDRWARQVLVLIPTKAPERITEQEFFALGFSHRPLPMPLNLEYAAYSFSITRYKPTPDWLNAKFWANPERWTKN